ncbi:cytochrome c oxidase assembly protein [Frigoribacterium sp. CFBP 13707]|uniref:cytochrome c oxidase assembly protein n=1 Tax=Frigoribacterium sp. CFBP 13707 TaxID=2775313 RepID=UPI001786E607|nr:cytochrome c oxidase assembly protein [Frigoribacterium sp. CFBP 13707]MBD8729196.1 bifunctional copper resistance protein CopD/cytochrome c oxidase assembly protein [Frigoribacterium sp. CFBP 13707]
MTRITRASGPALLVLVAFLSLLAALQFGGAADAPLVVDPGEAVRWGLPIAKMLNNVTAAVTIGTLFLTCFALSRKEAEFERAMDIAAGAAGAWTVASAATAFFTFLSVANVPVTFDDQFGRTLAFFLTNTELGVAWLTTTLIAAGVTVLAFALRNIWSLVALTLLAMGGLIPIAQQGHAAGASGHDAAVTDLALHLEGASVWLGGLVALVLLRPTLEKGRIGVVLARYSTVAIICFVVVAVSGVGSAALRLGDWAALTTGYGVLVLVKTLALVALGLFGVVQRRWLVARMSTHPAATNRFFWCFVSAELAFMGLASGVAAALGRTATPVEQVVATDLADPTPAEILTEEVLPRELTPLRYLTEWNPDLLWALLCAFGIFFYVAGVVRLRRRGDQWSLGRTVSWIAGLVVLFYITCGAPNVYEEYLFSMHMLAHMALGMVVPVLLVPGAPVTLALRAIRKRQDGTRGPREWIMVLVHSTYAHVISNPIVSAVLFAGSLFVFYYTSLFSWATTTHLGHYWMIVHFLIVGYLFVQSMIGIDPVKGRLPYPMRLLVLLATMAFHAFFGLSIMTSTSLFLADWYGAMGRTWGATPVADQYAAGGIAWSVGEIPTVSLAIAVAIMWSRSDSREAKRKDRQAERDGDAELDAYNEQLGALARSDRRG